MAAPRIKAIQCLPDYRLLVTFIDGVQKEYDCSPLLVLNAFRLLREPAFFRTVAVDPGGYGVSWNDDADLSEYELWTRGAELSLSPDNSNSQRVLTA